MSHSLFELRDKTLSGNIAFATRYAILKSEFSGSFSYQVDQY